MARPPSASSNNAQPHAPEHSTNSPKERRHWLEYIAVLLSAIAIIIAGIAAVFTWWQASLIKDSNDISRQNNVVNQRAFVYSTMTQTFFSPDPNDPQAVNFSLIMTNSGNTATRNLIFFLKCTPSAEDLQEPWSILYQGKDTIVQIPQFIGPHASVQVACSFSFDQIKQMFAGKLHGYIMLDITYHDRMNFEPIHQTNMALKLTQIVLRLPETLTLSDGKTQITPTSFLTALEPRGRHNCADEECPKNY
jgi:hypothetical protein